MTLPKEEADPIRKPWGYATKKEKKKGRKTGREKKKKREPKKVGE
jgi:hypothetical protein